MYNVSMVSQHLEECQADMSDSEIESESEVNARCSKLTQLLQTLIFGFSQTFFEWICL